MIQVNIHIVEILRIRKRLIGKQVIHIKRVLRQFYPRLSQYFRLKHKCMHNQILRWMKMSDCVPVAHFFSWKYISVIHRFLDSLIQMIVHIITDDQIRKFSCSFQISITVEPVVGIHDFIIKSMRQLQPFVHTGTMTAVWLMHRFYNVWIKHFVFICDRTCPVGRTIVNNEDLDILAAHQK